MFAIWGFCKVINDGGTARQQGKERIPYPKNEQVQNCGKWKLGSAGTLLPFFAKTDIFRTFPFTPRVQGGTSPHPWALRSAGFGTHGFQRDVPAPVGVTRSNPQNLRIWTSKPSRGRRERLPQLGKFLITRFPRARGRRAPNNWCRIGRWPPNATGIRAGVGGRRKSGLDRWAGDVVYCVHKLHTHVIGVKKWKTN